MTRQCTSCAARPEDGAVFPLSNRNLCADCLVERTGLPAMARMQRPGLLTRAMWRARRRARDAAPQRDLVDWIERTA